MDIMKMFMSGAAANGAAGLIPEGFAESIWRDMFAMAAMNATIQRCPLDQLPTAEQLAAESYGIADAMLAERAKPRPVPES